MGIFSYSSCTLGTTFPGMAFKLYGPTPSFLTPSTSTFINGWYNTPHTLVTNFTPPASLYPSTNIVTAHASFNFYDDEGSHVDYYDYLIVKVDDYCSREV